MLRDQGIVFANKSLVSCVTVTEGRVDLLGAAIRGYLSQTYSPKEMIIVSQGTKEQNDNIRKMIEPHEDIHFCEAPPTLTLGAMRNLSVELAHGDIICQWDDDDFYHPTRVNTQYRHLRNSVACLYTSYLKYFADTRKLYMIDHLGGTDDYLDVLKQQPHKAFLCGSLMFNKSCFHKSRNILYPERGSQSDTEEDLNVLQKLMKMGDVVGIRTPYEYCYVFHGGNVYDRKHHEMLFHKKKIGTPEELWNIKSNVELLLNIAQTSEVDVCTSKIIDFDFETTIEEKVVYRYSPSWK